MNEREALCSWLVKGGIQRRKSGDKGHRMFTGHPMKMKCGEEDIRWRFLYLCILYT